MIFVVIIFYHQCLSSQCYYSFKFERLDLKMLAFVAILQNFDKIIFQKELAKKK